MSNVHSFTLGLKQTTLSQGGAELLRHLHLAFPKSFRNEVINRSVSATVDSSLHITASKDRIGSPVSPGFATVSRLLSARLLCFPTGGSELQR